MSILIKGMEMPESCDMCAFSSYIAEGDDHEELWYCILDNWNQITPILLTKDTVSNGRSMDCPLVELPPHGRLIDADALVKDLKRQCEEVFKIDAVSPDDFWIKRDKAYNERLWKTWCESFFEYLKARETIIEAEGRE